MLFPLRDWWPDYHSQVATIRLIMVVPTAAISLVLLIAFSAKYSSAGIQQASVDSLRYFTHVVFRIRIRFIFELTTKEPKVGQVSLRNRALNCNKSE